MVAPKRFVRSLLLIACVLGSAGSVSAQSVFRDSFESPPEGPLTDAEAARFLNQATFGATLPEITRLRTLGYTAWLNQQFAAPASLQLPHLDQLMQVDPSVVWQDKRNDIWFRNVLSGNDQLRQRLAFALSQILVVSDQNGAVEGNPNALAHYHDMLSTSAFGNYRTLLESVTLHPVPGRELRPRDHAAVQRGPGASECRWQRGRWQLVHAGHPAYSDLHSGHHPRFRACVHRLELEHLHSAGRD
jgi:hypothetical protein